VITFVDVTEIVRIREELRKVNEQMRLGAANDK